MRHDHLTTFLCGVSPPHIMNIWTHFYVRCPHPLMNILTHFHVRCPQPLMNIWAQFHVWWSYPIATLGSLLDARSGSLPTIPLLSFLQIFCSVPTLVWTSYKIILIWIFSVPSSSQTFYNFLWCPNPSLNYWPNILNGIVHCTPSPLPTLITWDDILVLNLCPLLSGMCAPPPSLAVQLSV